MKDEIKKILDRLERIDHKEYIAFEFADSATFDEVARCFEERKKLSDSITNLQIIEKQYSAILSENAELENKVTNLQEQLHQASLEIQELSERDFWCPSNCDKLIKLKEKNERLKEKVEQYENPNDMTLFYMWLDEKAKHKIKQLQKENELNNDKIYKAIDKLYCWGEILDPDFQREMLNILKGEDNER